MRLRWSPTARDQLKSIETSLRSITDDMADAQIRRITDRGRQLVLFPESGRVVANLDFVGLREILERPYRILYIVLDDEVIILAVVHAARNLP